MNGAVKLTVLTDPIHAGFRSLTENAKTLLRKVRDRLSPPPAYMRSRYRGHFAVTRSLIEGLGSLGFPYNYNPGALSEVAEVVLVLAGVPTLHQAISLKRKGLIKQLLAGPNIVDFPSDHHRLICAPEVDICLTPGPLTCDLYVEDCPELSSRCLSWPTGVDIRYWSPTAKLQAPSLLVYDKGNSSLRETVRGYLDRLRAAGCIFNTIHYGRYTHNDYRQVLLGAEALIGFSQSESQGLAWAEAWAMDVPTFIWRNDRHVFDHPRSAGRSFRSSTAPYLSKDNGAFFDSPEGLMALLKRLRGGDDIYSPRRWVMANMSDETCARRLLQMAGLENKPIAS